jgi:hypothetical protein
MVVAVFLLSGNFSEVFNTSPPVATKENSRSYSKINHEHYRVSSYDREFHFNRHYQYGPFWQLYLYIKSRSYSRNTMINIINKIFFIHPVYAGGATTGASTGLGSITGVGQFQTIGSTPKDLTGKFLSSMITVIYFSLGALDYHGGDKGKVSAAQSQMTQEPLVSLPWLPPTSS